MKKLRIPTMKQLEITMVEKLSNLMMTKLMSLQMILRKTRNNHHKLDLTRKMSNEWI